MSARVPLVSVALGALLATPLVAKAPTVRLVVTCAGLSAPIVIADSARLSFALGPWGDGFFNAAPGAVAAPRHRWPPCEVAFYVRYGPADVELAYVVYYYPRSRGRSGYVHFPGRDDPWYRLNAGTILRPGVDGQWRHSSAAWESTILGPALAGITSEERRRLGLE